MRLLQRAAISMLILALAATIVGCSAGTAGGPDADSTEASSGQSASAIFVQQWGQILWGLVANQTGSQQPIFGPPVFNPDGSISVSFTGADGTEATLTQRPDGTAVLEMTYADGSTQTTEQSKPVFDGVSKTTIDWSVDSSNGVEVDYTSIVDDKGTIFDISDDTTALTGGSTLPGGTTQTFDVMTADGSSHVESAQSDGSTFTLDVPLAKPDFTIPDFTQSSTGNYASEDFDIDLTLDSTAGSPTRWARMGSELGGGLTGAFALEPDFSGSGRLRENGSLLAVITWDKAGDTEIKFVSAARGATSPAGAAVDFLIHRWQTLAALLAPSAGAAGTAGANVIGRGGQIDVAGLAE